MRKYTVATGKNQSITQQYRHNQHPFTVKLNPLQTNLYNTLFYLQVFWGLFSVALHFQSWSVAVMSNLQLLGLFNCLPALFLSPLITTHPSLWIGPPSVCGRGYTNGGITHNLGSHTTLSQRWRMISTSLLSPPQKKLPGLKIRVIQFPSKKFIAFIQQCIESICPNVVPIN